jgi:type VI protein secretion system component Hcp
MSFDYFLKVAGVDGGSQDAQHPGEFVALGYEFDLAAMMAAATGGGGGVGKITFSPLIVDLATTPGLADLLTKAADGLHIPTVTFTVEKTGANPFDFETITLSDVTITSYEEKAGFAPRVALAYDKIEVDLTEQNPTGGAPITHVFSFDLAANGATITPPPAQELAPSVPAATSVDYFLDIPGVDGGSLDAQHHGAFELSGYEFDLASTIAAATGTGGGTVDIVAVGWTAGRATTFSWARMATIS